MHERLYNKVKWLLCPICNNKTRLKVRVDTVLENFPLFCPKCKQETVINVKQLYRLQYGIAVYENDRSIRSSTGLTVQYAMRPNDTRKKGVQMRFIHPDNGKVTE